MVSVFCNQIHYNKKKLNQWRDVFIRNKIYWEECKWIPYGGVCPHCLDLCNTLFPQIPLLLHSHCTPVSAYNWREKYKKY